MKHATHLTVQQLLNRANAWGFTLRVDRSGPEPSLVIQWTTVTAGQEIPSFVAELIRREGEVLDYLRLRAPAAPGTVPPASPGGEDWGASAESDAPLVAGGQGRTGEILVQDLKALAVIATLFVGVSLIGWAVHEAFFAPPEAPQERPL